MVSLSLCCNLFEVTLCQDELIEITKNVSKMCKMGIVGALSIMLFSSYQFYKLKRNGMATKEALINVGKQTLFSLSLLAVSIAAQGIWGGPAGIIVSVSTGIILIVYTVDIVNTGLHFFLKDVRPMQLFVMIHNIVDVSPLVADRHLQSIFFCYSNN